MTMNNYIFLESDFDHTLLCDIDQNGITLFESSSLDSTADFLAELTASTSRGEIYRYVVLTTHPEKYSVAFISNNVINITGKTAAQIAKAIAWVFSDFGRNLNPSQDDMVFFCSDLHSNHRNIIK